MCPQKLIKRKKIKQLFNAHFVEVNHNGEDDSEDML